jgi:hypothetical protein
VGRRGSRSAYEQRSQCVRPPKNAGFGAQTLRLFSSPWCGAFAALSHTSAYFRRDVFPDWGYNTTSIQGPSNLGTDLYPTLRVSGIKLNVNMNYFNHGQEASAGYNNNDPCVSLPARVLLEALRRPAAAG